MKEAYIIQVGAHTGNSSNPQIKTIEPNKKYILIEPVPFLYQKLYEHHKDKPNVTLLNIAISDFNGSSTLYTPSQNNDFSKLPIWTSELSSKNKKHLEAHIPKLIIDKISVQCKTLNHIIKEYQINEAELICVDAEGHDYEILMNLNLNRLKPKKIIFENKHMDIIKHNNPQDKTRERYKNLLNHFISYGYIVENENSQDTYLRLRK
jgi:FkbM family methyltransferase